MVRRRGREKDLVIHREREGNPRRIGGPSDRLSGARAPGQGEAGSARSLSDCAGCFAPCVGCGDPSAGTDIRVLSLGRAGHPQPSGWRERTHPDGHRATNKRPMVRRPGRDKNCVDHREREGSPRRIAVLVTDRLRSPPGGMAGSAVVRLNALPIDRSGRTHIPTRRPGR